MTRLRLLLTAPSAKPLQLRFDGTQAALVGRRRRAPAAESTEQCAAAAQAAQVEP